jgi:hypothetical protein
MAWTATTALLLFSNIDRRHRHGNSNRTIDTQGKTSLPSRKMTSQVKLISKSNIYWSRGNATYQHVSGTVGDSISTAL